jgi:hypothetical protein
MLSSVINLPNPCQYSATFRSNVVPSSIQYSAVLYTTFYRPLYNMLPSSNQYSAVLYTIFCRSLNNILPSSTIYSVIFYSNILPSSVQYSVILSLTFHGPLYSIGRPLSDIRHHGFDSGIFFVYCRLSVPT